MNSRIRLLALLLTLSASAGLLLLVVPAEAQISAQLCVTANVVALDQPFFWNRLGAYEPQGQIFALRRDVVSTLSGSIQLTPGNVALRSDKRARPLVLRVNVGECLSIRFENLLAPNQVNNKQPATRAASIHVTGMELVSNISDDGSNVGTNSSSLVLPGQSTTYQLSALREGTYLLHSNGALVAGEGEGGSISTGLFGAVNVEPASSEYYRSQITESDMTLVTSNFGSINIYGLPTFNYNALYPSGHPFAGTPILKMRYRNELIHSDLNAIITGPNAGAISPSYPEVEVYRDRQEPFREFTVIFHDEIGAKQAFPDFFDDGGAYEHALHSVRDAFAINYGTGGIGAEILANRLGVGPMYQCDGCKYEEFFLSAWAVGDPAMVVDIPANSTNLSGQLITGPKATKAFYPDDPSNVHHSYMSDHVKFRNLLAGSDDHHIFHLHAHQWLHTPDADNSTYLDSQAIGQGTGFTYEIAYDGSGNRNKTVGDSIFHCHFYPHFAQGMWAMWRVHDVLELGTELDVNGRPATGSRAYPDGEIAAGTPIPALVPTPTKPLAPLPGANVSIVNGQVNVAGNGNPGYPFYIPGVAGERVPRPPLDTLWDGGLPRHVVVKSVFTESHTPYDFSKDLVKANALAIPEAGTPLEQTAMAAHSVRLNSTCLPNGVCDSISNPVKFLYNGAAPQPGAPYADPCIDDNGNPLFFDNGTAVDPSKNRFLTYQAANIQTDVFFNKEGWHYGQQRFISLWDDIGPFLSQTKPPEPFFFRANTGDCVEFQHSNLVPAYYELDDFQVRTPTDVLGQHIHLVKFDVTSSDGSGNGWNYEDGNLGPEEVRHLITAINLGGGLINYSGGGTTLLTPTTHPVLGAGPNNDWVGAQVSAQRWYVDDVLNQTGKDRTLRTVFTHDHFGPSTHQQSGLYAGLVVERRGSLWFDPVTGTQMGSRYDGGPTSWQANIQQTQFNDCDPLGLGIASNADDFCRKESFREFLLEFGDFQQAYEEGFGYSGPDHDHAINPPECPAGVPTPCPEAVSAADSGTMLVNYRNEPIALRVQKHNTLQQAPGQAGDLSYAFSSQVTRSNPALNSVMPYYPTQLTPGVLPLDPATPLLRVKEGDPVQIRILVGAHEEEHNLSISGVRWPFEPSFENSGYRASQMMGISEHFEFEIPILPQGFTGPQADFLYRAGSSVDDLWNGLWGILRVYNRNGTEAGSLLDLPGSNNVTAETVIQGWDGACPVNAATRTFKISAVAAKDALSGGSLIYNRNSGYNGKLKDRTAIMFVRDSDLDANFNLKPTINEEPLIIRAQEGECIEVFLTNRLQTPLLHFKNGASKLPKIVREIDPLTGQLRSFGMSDIHPSEEVGLHPQLVYADVTNSDGLNVGLNPTQTASPGQTVSYKWYAGEVAYSPGQGRYQPVGVEYGSTGLSSSDPILHSNKGAVGALIIEPKNASWTEIWCSTPPHQQVSPRL